MNIGLTGSSGILGSILKKKLNLKKKNCFLGKIENLNNVNNWIKKNKFDYIIHLAAVVPTIQVKNNKNKALKVNYIGTKNLINAINKYSKKKIWFFYSSTSHVYNFKKTQIFETDETKPISYYGVTKLKAEKYILKNQYMYDACIGRIFSFTSINQSKDFIIPSILLKLKSSSKKIFFKNLNHDRDFLKVNDIVHIIVKLLKNKSKGVFNICSGNKLNLIQILYKLNMKYKKILVIKKNKRKTTIFGSNSKLIKNLTNYSINKSNYLDYLYKNY